MKNKKTKHIKRVLLSLGGLAFFLPLTSCGPDSAFCMQIDGKTFYGFEKLDDNGLSIIDNSLRLEVDQMPYRDDFATLVEDSMITQTITIKNESAAVGTARFAYALSPDYYYNDIDFQYQKTSIFYEDSLITPSVYTCFYYDARHSISNYDGKSKYITNTLIDDSFFNDELPVYIYDVTIDNTYATSDDNIRFKLDLDDDFKVFASGLSSYSLIDTGAVTFYDSLKNINSFKVYSFNKDIKTKLVSALANSCVNFNGGLYSSQPVVSATTTTTYGYLRNKFYNDNKTLFTENNAKNYILEKTLDYFGDYNAVARDIDIFTLSKYQQIRYLVKEVTLPASGTATLTIKTPYFPTRYLCYEPYLDYYHFNFSNLSDEHLDKNEIAVVLGEGLYAQDLNEYEHNAETNIYLRDIGTHQSISFSIENTDEAPVRKSIAGTGLNFVNTLFSLFVMITLGVLFFCLIIAVSVCMMSDIKKGQKLNDPDFIQRKRSIIYHDAILALCATMFYNFTLLRNTFSYISYALAGIFFVTKLVLDIIHLAKDRKNKTHMTSLILQVVLTSISLLFTILKVSLNGYGFFFTFLHIFIVIGYTIVFFINISDFSAQVRRGRQGIR